MGKMSQENYFFSPPLIGTNWFPPHSFVPPPLLPSFHDLTSAHKHVLPPIAEKFRVLFFSTIQTKHNIQSTTYCYLALRGALECDLSWIVLPWGRTSARLKICPFWQNLPLSNKSFALVFAIVWQNVSRQDNCFFVFLNYWTRSRSHKTYSHLFSVTSDTLMMKSTNCYKICPLVRIGPQTFKKITTFS